MATNKKSVKKEQQEQIYKTIITIITVIVILIFVGLWLYDYFYGGEETPPYAYAEGNAAVHFLDVGQGDSVIIQLPDEKNMIIDAGTAGQASKVKSYINSLGITHFDVVLLTHTDADHCGGFGGQGTNLSGVFTISGLSVDTIYMPRIKSASAADPLKGNANGIETASYRNFVTAAVNSGAEIVYTATTGNGDDGILTAGTGYKAEIYAPRNTAVYDGINENSSGADKNKVSPVLILEYNGKRVMFTGDATGTTEDAFLSYTQLIDVKVDVLKVAHHGSGTEGSNSQAFYNAVRPAFSVISVNEGSYNNMPAADVIGRIKNGSGFQKLFRTDKDGDIVCTIDKDGEISWWTSAGGAVSVAVIKTSNFDALFIFLTGDMRNV